MNPMKKDKYSKKSGKFGVSFKINLCSDVKHGWCVLVMFVLFLFQLKLVVKWELQDDNKKDLACLQVPIAVV